MRKIDKKYIIMIIIVLLFIINILVVQNFKLSKTTQRYEEYLTKEIDSELTLMVSSIKKSKTTIDSILENNFITIEQFRTLRSRTSYILSSYHKMRVISKDINNEVLSPSSQQLVSNIYTYFDFYLSKEIASQNKYELSQDEVAILSNIADLLLEYEDIVEENKTDIEKEGYLTRNNKVWINILKSMDTISQDGKYSKMLHEQYFNLYN